VYIIEFKVVELTAKGNALQQIKAKKYHEKYSAVKIGTSSILSGKK